MLNVKCLIKILVVFGKFYLSTAETTFKEQYTVEIRNTKSIKIVLKWQNTSGI